MAVKQRKRTLLFHGRAGTLFGIHITNLFLTIVTCGIYSFWGRARIRKYLWGQFEFEKDRLSYYGTGAETFKGWLKAAAIFGIPYLLTSDGPRWMGARTSLIVAGTIAALLLVLLFYPMAVVGSRRYRLSRTAWRGIRFSFRENWKNYVNLSWEGNILTLLTLGLYAPYYQMNREKFLISNSCIGNRHFDFDGKGRDLFGNYLLALLLAVPTLAFSLYWYHVVKRRYIWNHTKFGKARFDCTITLGGMLGVDLLNLFSLAITLGFAYPWTHVRSINYMVQNLDFKGKADLRSIKQKAQPVNATGEELAGFFDLDFDLG